MYQDKAGNIRFLRILTWIEGRMLIEVNPHTPQLLENLGQNLGLFCTALKDFDHTAAHRIFNWDTANGHWVKEFLTIFETTEQQEIAQYAFHCRFDNHYLNVKAQKQCLLHRISPNMAQGCKCPPKKEK